jgi:hypothetical protein
VASNGVGSGEDVADGDLPVSATAEGGSAMNFDAVLSVAIAIVIIVFLGFKVRRLMDQDAARHENQ